MSTEQNTPGGDPSGLPSGSSVIMDLQNSKLMEMMADRLEVEEEPDLDEDGKPFIITVIQR